MISRAAKYQTYERQSGYYVITNKYYYVHEPGYKKYGSLYVTLVCFVQT